MSVTFIPAAVELFLGGIAGAVLFGMLAMGWAFGGGRLSFLAPVAYVLFFVSVAALVLGAGDQVSFWLGIGRT